MNSITPEQYFKYSLQNNLLYEIDYFYSLFAIIQTNTKYITIKDNKYYAIINNEEYLLDGVSSKTLPILNISTPITLSNKEIENISGNVNTTIGRAIFNKVIVSRNFKDKIPYINQKTSISFVEDIITKLMLNDTIKVEEFLNFTDSVMYLENLASILNYSATPTNIADSPGFLDFKKKTIKEFDEKYGKDWVKSIKKGIEFQKKLVEYDTPYIQKDVTYKKTLGKKALENSRVKQHLTFGPETGFRPNEDKGITIINSLLEGYPTDKDSIQGLFNNIRSASYGRGVGTAEGGELTKIIFRALSSLTINEVNCGSNTGITVTVTEDNYETIGLRYIMNGSSVKLINNPKEYIGKTITIRSPMYCLTQNGFCEVCMGDKSKDYKTSIAMSGAEIGNDLMLIQMKAMHDRQIKTTELDIKKILY